MSSTTLKSNKSIKSIKQPDKDRVEPVAFVPYNWLKDAKIYNKRWVKVPNDWIIENADVVVLVFTARGVDREGIMKKFYHVYESTKYNHIPIEVIFIPMDETEDDALSCYKDQANWFTLRFDDILIHTLKFMYGITCIPHLLVFNTKCEVISYNGIDELNTYGKNAVVSWLSLAPTTKRQRRRSEDAEFYGPVWRFVKMEEKLSKYEYQKRFKEDGKPMPQRPGGPGHAYKPGGYVKPKKGPDAPEGQPKPPGSAGEQGLETSAETYAETPQDGKPSVTQIRLPEDQFATAESHALLADDLYKSRNDLERSSTIAKSGIDLERSSTIAKSGIDLERSSAIAKSGNDLERSSAIAKSGNDLERSSTIAKSGIDLERSSAIAKSGNDLERSSTIAKSGIDLERSSAIAKSGNDLERSSTIAKSGNDLERSSTIAKSGNLRSSASTIAQPSFQGQPSEPSVQGQPSKSHVTLSESESKHSKPRVQLPDDVSKAESHSELTESRSKSATQSGQTSESNVLRPTASRSKSAKFADDV